MDSAGLSSSGASASTEALGFLEPFTALVSLEGLGSLIALGAFSDLAFVEGGPTLIEGIELSDSPSSKSSSGMRKGGVVKFRKGERGKHTFKALLMSRDSPPLSLSTGTLSGPGIFCGGLLKRRKFNKRAEDKRAVTHRRLDRKRPFPGLLERNGASNRVAAGTLGRRGSRFWCCRDRLCSRRSRVGTIGVTISVRTPITL